MYPQFNHTGYLPSPGALCPCGSLLLFTVLSSQQQGLSVHTPGPCFPAAPQVHILVLWTMGLQRLCLLSSLLLPHVFGHCVIPPCWEGKRKWVRREHGEKKESKMGWVDFNVPWGRDPIPTSSIWWFIPPLQPQLHLLTSPSFFQWNYKWSLCIPEFHTW